MAPAVSLWGFCIAFCVGMTIMIEIGRRVGDRRRARGVEDDKAGLTTVEGAVFALFGLMIAFTFSGAANHLIEKRMLIAEEANAIEVAYMRTQLLPEAARAPVQELMRQYTDSRLEVYRRLPDTSAARDETHRTREIQEKIWAAAVAGSTQPGAHPDAGKLLLPAINGMIDIATVRFMALQIHPPLVVYLLLFVLGMLCSLLAGYRMSGVRHRSWLHILTFVFIMVSVVYVILDVEYPRVGFIQLDSADQFMVDVRQAMH